MAEASETTASECSGFSSITILRTFRRDGEHPCWLFEKFGSVPVIEMYRQAAIRCQKARDWARMRSWAERGLAVYASDAARPEAVADLQKRLVYADAKLAGKTGSGNRG